MNNMPPEEFKIALLTSRSPVYGVCGKLMEIIQSYPSLMAYVPEKDPESLHFDFDADGEPIDTIYVEYIPRHHPDFVEAVERVEAHERCGYEVITLRSPIYNYTSDEMLIEYVTPLSAYYDARIIPEPDTPLKHETPLVPVTELEELLDNFIGGDGSSGEEYLQTAIQAIIDRHRGVEEKFTAMVDWSKLNTVKIPGCFPPTGNNHPFLDQWTNGQLAGVIPRNDLIKATIPLAEGRYRIKAVAEEQGMLTLYLDSDVYLFVLRDTIDGTPVKGDILHSTGMLEGKSPYSIIKANPNDL